jgi:hypothetical protein
MEVENFKKLPNDHDLVNQNALRIYLTYFKGSSDKELNITAKERLEIEENLKKPSQSSFDSIQTGIFNLMIQVRSSKGDLYLPL